MFNRFKGEKMLGMLAIGNGEKCSFCKLIIDEDIDVLKHFMKYHEKELLKTLFGGEDDGSNERQDD